MLTLLKKKTGGEGGKYSYSAISKKREQKFYFWIEYKGEFSQIRIPKDNAIDGVQPNLRHLILKFQ